MFKSCTIIVVFIVIVTFFATRASAQTFDTEFAPEPEFAPQLDESVFQTPAWSIQGPFEEFARYRFNSVRYRERGLDNRHFKVSLGGIDLTDNLTGYTDYSLITLVRRGGLAIERVPAMVAGSGLGLPAVLGGLENYSLTPAASEFYLLLRAGDRYSRGGGDIRHSHVASAGGPGSSSRGWSHTLAVTGEGGSDNHINGVFTNALGAVTSLSKEWRPRSDARQSVPRLTLFAAANFSERGARTAATEEAFSLIGDKFYNPVWGFQEGRIRNSRINSIRQIFGAVQFETPVGADRTFSITAAYRHALSGRSRLAWFDTHSPLPDYYRSMPSFFPDGQVADELADAWRVGDAAVTQVDWYSFYYNNTLSGDGLATYLIEDQMEQTDDANLRLVVTRQIETGLEFSYGARARYENSRFFKIARDLLGATWVANVDQYVDDQTDGEYHAEPPNKNDLRHPDRRVLQGQRFGYDYSFTRLQSSAFAVLHWNRDNYGLTTSASLTHSRLQREGFYEKELFPGDAGGGSIWGAKASGDRTLGASFGRSAVAAFTTFSASLSAYWNPAPHHSLSLSAVASTEPPFAGSMFLSPEQNSLMISDLTPSGLYGAEFSWAFIGEVLTLRTAGFVNAQTSETQVRRYYDDLAGTFADMVVRGVDRLAMGVELGAEVRLARPLTLSVGGSVGDFRYNSEPVATIFEDATGRVISDNIVCYLSGLRTGLPQMVAGAELEYSDRRYWRIGLYGEWMASRHVEINPLYHSSRIAGISPSPEIMTAFVSQEQLPDALTLGASISKGWALGRGYLRIAGAVRNILSSNIIYSGYEQMRIRRLGSGLERTMVPFPTKYMWAYPMTWNLTISYRL